MSFKCRICGAIVENANQHLRRNHPKAHEHMDYIDDFFIRLKKTVVQKDKEKTP